MKATGLDHVTPVYKTAHYGRVMQTFSMKKQTAPPLHWKSLEILVGLKILPLHYTKMGQKHERDICVAVWTVGNQRA